MLRHHDGWANDTNRQARARRLGSFLCLSSTVLSYVDLFTHELGLSGLSCESNKHTLVPAARVRHDDAAETPLLHRCAPMKSGCCIVVLLGVLFAGEHHRFSGDLLLFLDFQ